ncbi:hypothetical protein JCM8097_005109 [Rhodosporidiobolus ruineniae]
MTLTPPFTPFQPIAYCLPPPGLSTTAHFRQHFLATNEPCLFPREYTAGWALFRRWFTAPGELDWEYLRREYGAEVVEVVDCPSSAGEGTKGDEDDDEAISTFADLLDLWRDGRGRSKYLKDWHLPLLLHRRGAASFPSHPSSSSPSPSSSSDATPRTAAESGRLRVSQELYDVPPAWADDWMNELECDDDDEGSRGDDFRFVYAGGGESWTGLHRDVYASYSISTNLHGRKRWYLFPPPLTPLLRPLIQAAERSGCEGGVNCDAWSEKEKREWRERGMREVEQGEGESIFIPSGWFHSVHNLTHPTLSLNHNWANAFCLPSIYSSLCTEVDRARDAIEDVRELLVEAARRRGEGEEGWRAEWEVEVDALVSRSEGWSFPLFFRLIRHALSLLLLSDDEVVERARGSRWPPVVPAEEARAEAGFCVEQVRPILSHFRHTRAHQEWRYLDGLEAVLEACERECERVEGEVRRRAAGEEEGQ